MDIEQMRNSQSGTLVLTEQSQMAFVPNPLPPTGVQYESLMARLSRADRLVGTLNGSGRAFQNPDLLMRPLARWEAVASSSIEGTHTTLNDLFIFEARDDAKNRPPDTKEVHNYVTALETAIAALNTVPISTRLIVEIHKNLLQGVPQNRGGQIVPGQYKRAQNFIGGRTLQIAKYIPAPPSEIERLMGDLENYINLENDSIPPLIAAALAHYQFEAIHPFADGNGRVGRVLIPLLLKSKGVLDAPLLYVSPYIEEHIDEYIERLFMVSANGEWLEWVAFFLKAVEITAERTIMKLDKLHDINLDYLDRIKKARNSALLKGLVDCLFFAPFITIPAAAKVLGVTYRAAQNNILKLVESGILAEVPDDVRPRLYFAKDILDVVRDV